MKKNTFEQATQQIESRTFYHGSATKIDGDFLEPKEQFNSVQNKRVVGAFVTSDADYAKFFALVKCISGRGQCNLHGKKIFFERISDSIKPEFNLYTVVENPGEKFIHDKGTEYYSPTPIKISKRQTCNTVEEIEKLGYEIYVLNEPLKNKTSKQAGDNSRVQSEMQQAIADGAYHRVDIANLIRQQKSKSIFHKLFNWQKD
ncbi:MAG: hypothetical protein IJE82_01625 [Alphaproteobacteria bacterium]|nr:hypothetical protein [Alphaproteobacteria bacterium]